MPNFNNCNVAILLKNNAVAKFKSPIEIKNSLDTAVIVSNNSLLVHPGISGSTGSSFNILDSKRGIQIQNNSRLDIENANITNTQYGFVSLNSSSFDFNKSVINGSNFASSTGQAYGMYIADRSAGNIFQSSITGYAGGTASLTSGNVAVVKNSTLFVGTTADSLRVNTVALGSSLLGEVLVDTSLGNKIINFDSVISVITQGEM